MKENCLSITLLFILINGFCLVRNTAKGREVCYGKYGCFSDLPPYYNDLLPLPLGPEFMGTKFRLFTKYTTNDDGDIIDVLNSDSLGYTFQAGGQIVLIIHGFVENGLKQWIIDLKEALLSKTNVSSVISVDWAYGASPYQTYPQAAGNTRVVGAQVEEFIEWLCQAKNLTTDDFYILGASLGAHIAGYAGRRLREKGLLLRRITGLDPAGPGFLNVDPVLRLDPSDASFVDIIHTDIGGALGAYGIGGFGIAKPIGHLDFYPNGGDNQPMCKKSFYSAFKEVVNGKLAKVLGCSHNRAIYLFLQSVKPSCPLWSYPCENWNGFKSGKCSRRCQGKCVEMGFNAEKYKDKRGTFYLETSGEEPFCLVSYKVTIFSSVFKKRSFSIFKPQIKIKILGDSGSSSEVEIARPKPGEISFSLKSPPLEQMKAVRLWYRGAPKRTFHRVKIVPLEDGYGEFCSQIDATLSGAFYYHSVVSSLTKDADC